MIKYTRLKEQDGGGDDWGPPTTPGIKLPTPQSKSETNPPNTGKGNVSNSGSPSDGYNADFDFSKINATDLSTLPSVALLNKDGKYYQISPEQVEQYQNQPGFMVGKLLHTSAFEKHIVGILNTIIRQYDLTPLSGLYTYTNFQTAKQQALSKAQAETGEAPNFLSGVIDVPKQDIPYEDLPDTVREWISIPDITRAFEKKFKDTRIGKRHQDVPDISRSSAFVLPTLIDGKVLLIQSDESQLENRNSAKKFVMELTKMVNISVPSKDAPVIMGHYEKWLELTKIKNSADAKVQEFKNEKSAKDKTLVDKVLSKLSAIPNSFPLLVKKRNVETGEETVEKFDPTNWPDDSTGDKVILNSQIDPQVAQIWQKIGKLFKTTILGLFGDMNNKNIRTIVNVEPSGEGQYKYTINEEEFKKILGTKPAAKMQNQSAIFDNPFKPGKKFTWDQILRALEGQRDLIGKELKPYDELRRKILTRFVNKIQALQMS